MVVGVTSLLLIIAFTNYSYGSSPFAWSVSCDLLTCVPVQVFTSALTFLLPFVCLISIVRAGYVREFKQSGALAPDS